MKKKMTPKKPVARRQLRQKRVAATSMDRMPRRAPSSVVSLVGRHHKDDTSFTQTGRVLYRIVRRFGHASLERIVKAAIKDPAFRALHTRSTNPEKAIRWHLGLLEKAGVLRTTV